MSLLGLSLIHISMCIRDRADAVENPIDRQALDLLFGTIAAGGDSLWFGTIQQYGKDHPEKFLDAMKSWQGIVSAETNRWDFFEVKGKRYQGYLVTLAILVGVAGLGIGLLTDNFIPLIFMPVSYTHLFPIRDPRC